MQALSFNLGITKGTPSTLDYKVFQLNLNLMNIMGLVIKVFVISHRDLYQWCGAEVETYRILIGPVSDPRDFDLFWSFFFLKSILLATS